MLTRFFMSKLSLCFVSVLRYAQSRCWYLVTTVNDVIADKNVVTKIMNNSTGLQLIELNGLAKRRLENWLLPIFIWLVFRPVLRPRLVPVV